MSTERLNLFGSKDTEPKVRTVTLEIIKEDLKEDRDLHIRINYVKDLLYKHTPAVLCKTEVHNTLVNSMSVEESRGFRYLMDNGGTREGFALAFDRCKEDIIKLLKEMHVNKEYIELNELRLDAWKEAVVGCPIDEIIVDYGIEVEACAEDVFNWMCKELDAENYHLDY